MLAESKEITLDLGAFEASTIPKTEGKDEFVTAV